MDWILQLCSQCVDGLRSAFGGLGFSSVQQFFFFECSVQQLGVCEGDFAPDVQSSSPPVLENRGEECGGG